MERLLVRGRALSPLESLIARRWRSHWVCTRCRPVAARGGAANYVATRSLATSSSNVGNTRRKPYYVTTPIFYVNAAPHVGHMYSMVLADIMKRWAQLRGETALLCTGTDEHGMKIQQAAQKADSDPKTFCDRGAEVFKTLAEKANISNDHFVRTTDPKHRETVEFAWQMLQDRGLIYESKHEGWYSVSDETFYPESAVHLTLDPRTGKKLMTSMETGKEVQWTSERNYHFRLSAFRDQLLDWYKQNPEWITPPSRMKEIVTQVESGLGDLSISRPVERLTWGIRVPNDPSQTIYVWLDALLNYITTAGYPWPPGSESSGGWPADVHVIGKDITRFHCIYWPAFLFALSLPLPKRILTHAHWTMSKQKMSKSLGNVVNPFFALDRFGVDEMRYYMAANGGIVDDADYDNDHIVNRYNSDLKNSLGNAVARVLRSRYWAIRPGVQLHAPRGLDSFVQECEDLHSPIRKSLKDVSEPWKTKTINTSLTEHLQSLRDLPGQAQAFIDEGNPTKAIKQIMQHAYALNAFLQAFAPWDIAKQIKKGRAAGEDTSALERRLDCVVFLAAESLRIVWILLGPFMPDKSATVLDMLGVKKDRRLMRDAVVCADEDYGEPNGDFGDELGVVFLPLGSDLRWL